MENEFQLNPQNEALDWVARRRTYCSKLAKRRRRSRSGGRSRGRGGLEDYHGCC